MTLDNFRTIELIWDKANKSIIKTIKTASSDTTGRYLSVKILDGGQEVDLDGAKLQLYWEHPNFNTSGTDNFTTVGAKGKFTLAFSDEMLTNIGELNAHLVLTLLDGKITSDGFTIEVIKGADSGVVVPTNGSGLIKQIDEKIDKGNVTLNDLTQEVKLAMTGGSVAIVGENAVGTENIKDNAVSEDKTTFFTPNPDAMLESTTWVNGYVGTDGKVASAQNNRASDFIEIKSNADYMIEVDENTGGVVTAYLGYYDVDKVFIERISIGQSYYTNGGFRMFTPPSNAKFIRVSFPVDHYLKFYIHEGSVQKPKAQPYFFNYAQETLTVEEISAMITASPKTELQPDFTDVVNTHNSSTKKLQVRNGSGIMNVFQPLTGGKWAEYTFQRNGNDDFILFQSLFLNDPLPDTSGFTRTYRLVEGSNKEFAFRGRPSGSTAEIRFFPEHEGIGTAFANSQKVYTDGVEYDFTRESHALYTEHEQVTIIQDMNLVFPGEPEPLARLVLHQTVNSKGVTYQGEIEFLRDMEIERGYVGMFPKTWEGFTKLKLSTGQELVTNQLHELDEIIGFPSSMAYVNDGSIYPDNAVVLAQTFINPSETLRVGQEGVRSPNTLWLQHRTATIDKVYPHVFDNHVMYAGDKYTFGVKMNMGLIPMADHFIK